jgi:hypothetical protein
MLFFKDLMIHKIENNCNSLKLILAEQEKMKVEDGK